jgi:hypothetical protein
MIILKLDFKKTFDKIEYELIIKILRHKCFPSRWVEWIQGILKSETSTTLLNGTVGKVFHCRRGVRQGDHLSPLLFVLAADLLQSIVSKVKNMGRLRVLVNVGYTSDFPIIQYVDDTLLIMDACPLQLFTIKTILNTFTDSTGLKVNYSKSNLYTINILEERLNHLAATFSVRQDF